MKKWAVALGLSALVFAACAGSGSSDNTGSTNGGSGGTSGTTEAPTDSTAAPTTEAPADVKPGVAALQAFAGEYEGVWNNTTYTTTGAFRINVTEVNTTANFALIAVDVDGSAFGGDDPDPGTAEIDFGPDPAQILGSIIRSSGDEETTIEFDDERNWTIRATPQGLNGSVITVQLTVTDGGFEGTYEIATPDGNVWAEGTFSASKV